MPFSIGIAKQVAYKKETTWGTAAAAGPSGSARFLRRVTSAFNLEKEAFESAEIRTDYQIADFRHGVRSATGTLSGELSPGTYSDFYGSVLSRLFTSGVAVTGLTYGIAVQAPGFRMTKTAGPDFTTSGIRVGDVVRITAATGNANNVNKNLLVYAVTANTIDVLTLDRSTLTTESAVASATVTVVGRKTFAPLTGHTDESYTIEEFFSDIAQSEVYTGLKVNTASVALPATGLVTAEFGFLGRDVTTGTAQYFTAPAAQGTTGVFAAVNGILMINGAPIALLTGLNVNISRNLQTATVVGSNSVAEIFEGRINVEGDFSAYFEDGSLRNLFLNETEASLVVAVTTSNAPNADFMTIVLPRIKVNSNTKDDGEQGIVAQHSFKALLPLATTTFERTTIQIQDSQAI